MRARIPSLRDLTLEALAKEAAEIPADLRAVSEHVLGQLIIIAALGRDFWVREIASVGEPLSGFFRSRTEVRVLHSAHLIWCLKDERGFDVLLEKNGDQDFESTYFELVAAEMIRSTSRDISFVAPSGVKGQDFDLRASGLWGLQDASIELKCRRSPFLSAKAIRNYLSGLRNQLPSGGNGVVFCKITPAGHGLLQGEITSTISSWIRTSTRRIKYVVLCWDPFDGDDVAIGIAYSVISEDGVCDLTLGNVGVDPLTTISFLRDLGIDRSLDETVVANILARAGAAPTTRHLGCWSSAERSWWRS